MEVIGFDGYTTEEKLAIARGYLWPRQLERNGLRAEEIEISDELLRNVVTEYTARRECASSSASWASCCARGHPDRLQRGRGPDRLDSETVTDALGRQRFFQESVERTATPRGHWIGGHRDRRRRAVHRGDGDGRRPRSGSDRAARRRDEGVGADRTVLRALARRSARHRRRPLPAGVPPPRARRRDPEGWPQRRHGDDHSPCITAERPTGQAHCRHDR